VQVGAGDRDIAVPGGSPDLGQCPTAGQSVADERVPAVVDGQRLEPDNRFPTLA
jgi:hypothetical protein